MRSIVGVGTLVCVLVLPGAASGQEIFHSTQSANLPTAQTYPGGAWLFEISHRFDTPVSQGVDAFWGLDGPVRNRLGLAYSATDRLTLGVQRTNYDDNVELNAKVRAYDGEVGTVPVAVAFMGGVAWNTDVFEIDGAEDNEAQAYAQLILDAGFGDRVAVGVVPTYLRNPRLRDFDAEDAFSLGIHGQLYLTRSISVLGEWIVSEERLESSDDSAAFGVEFETRGHFFKLILTNQARMNPTQFLAGTSTNFEPDEWRFGFNIQRLLPF